LSDLVAEARKTVKVRLFLKHADGAPAARHPRSR
jgi:hypothetical protein